MGLHCWYQISPMPPVDTHPTGRRAICCTAGTDTGGPPERPPHPPLFGQHHSLAHPPPWQSLLPPRTTEPHLAETCIPAPLERPWCGPPSPTLQAEPGGPTLPLVGFPHTHASVVLYLGPRCLSAVASLTTDLGDPARLQQSPTPTPEQSPGGPTQLFKLRWPGPATRRCRKEEDRYAQPPNPMFRRNTGLGQARSSHVTSSPSPPAPPPTPLAVCLFADHASNIRSASVLGSISNPPHPGPNLKERVGPPL